MILNQIVMMKFASMFYEINVETNNEYIMFLVY